METTIKSLANQSDEILTFSDEGSPTSEKITVKIGGKVIGDYQLSELMPALIGFDAKESRLKPDNY